MFIHPECADYRPCYNTKILREEKDEVYPYQDFYPFAQVIIPYAVELKHEKRLRFEDAQIYFSSSYVNRFRVIFSTQLILELCPARELMVDVVEGLLERLNCSNDVVDAFDHTPITADDLEIYFSFESYLVEYVDPMYICWMSLHDGIVRFYDGVLKDYNKDFWNERVEPYYKSKAFVELDRSAEEMWQLQHPDQEKPRESGYRFETGSNSSL